MSRKLEECDVTQYSVTRGDCGKGRENDFARKRRNEIRGVDGKTETTAGNENNIIKHPRRPSIEP